MPRRKRKGRTTKKNQNSSTGPDGDKDERAKAPHSFVFYLYSLRKSLIGTFFTGYLY